MDVETRDWDEYYRVREIMDEEPHEYLKNRRIHERKLEEIRQLIEFIGGFKHWTLLNNDCRYEVVKYLDYDARCSLGLCSKTDYQTVKKLPIYVQLMTVSEAEANEYCHTLIEKQKEIEVTTDFDYGKNKTTRISRRFSQKGKDTRVWISSRISKKTSYKDIYLKSTNYYDAAVNYVEKCMRKCNYKVNQLKVLMTGNRFANSGIRSLTCNSAEFGINNVATLNWWLRKLPEKMDKLFVYTFMEPEDRTTTLHANLLDLPQIKQVSNFELDCSAPFTDEQFINLQAESMVASGTEISSNGVNTFLKKWANGERDFRDVHLHKFRIADPTIILNGLDSRPWNDEFKAKFPELCEEFGHRWGAGRNRFQIKSYVNPFESVTLLINDTIRIFKTGHNTTKEGKTCTRWFVPDLMFDYDDN